MPRAGARRHRRTTGALGTVRLAPGEGRHFPLTEARPAPEITDNLICAIPAAGVPGRFAAAGRPAGPRHQQTERHPMSWFRNWVVRQARAARAPSFRPRLEPLEDRRLMNVSSAIDAHGNVMQLAVDNTFKLTQTFLGVSRVIGQDVLRAHAYRDVNGGIGFIIIYGADTGFQAVDYDHTGGHFLGSNIQDADKAYDKNGHVQLDITYASNGQFSTFEYTDQGARQVPYRSGAVAEFIHPFADARGQLAETISFFTTQSDNVLELFDSTGGHILANNAVADWAYSVRGDTFVLDVVYIGGGAFEYTPTAATHLGDNFRI
jgi:hypothetical protein